MDIINVKECPLCRSHQNQVFDRRVFRDFAVQNRLCSNCGFVFQSPRMSDADLAKFYEAEYRLAYQNEAGPTPKDLFIQGGRAVELAAFLRSVLPANPEPQVHLDIGCSSGLLLEKFRDDFKLHGIGVEPGDAYRKFAQQQGLQVVSNLEELPPPVKSQFGLISLVHVLEHLPEPVSYLRRLRQDYLSENGFLLVEVPNLYAHDSFEVAHLSAFSAHTLEQLLLQAGFILTAMRVHGAPRSKVLPLYLTALARDSGFDHSRLGVVPEKRVPLKRSLGLLRRRLLERLVPGLSWLPLPKS
jgi:SAM-dependent methyltransferase